MKIALDYDGTYTKDPYFWNEFIYKVLDSEHEIAFVTKRYKGVNPLNNISEIIEEVPHNIQVFYMCRRNKIFCEFKPDIWIDNNPFDITGYSN